MAAAKANELQKLEQVADGLRKAMVLLQRTLDSHERSSSSSAGRVPCQCASRSKPVRGKPGQVTLLCTAGSCSCRPDDCTIHCHPILLEGRGCANGCRPEDMAIYGNTTAKMKEHQQKLAATENKIQQLKQSAAAVTAQMTSSATAVTTSISGHCDLAMSPTVSASPNILSPAVSPSISPSLSNDSPPAPASAVSDSAQAQKESSALQVFAGSGTAQTLAATVSYAQVWKYDELVSPAPLPPSNNVLLPEGDETVVEVAVRVVAVRVHAPEFSSTISGQILRFVGRVGNLAGDGLIMVMITAGFINHAIKYIVPQLGSRRIKFIQLITTANEIELKDINQFLSDAAGNHWVQLNNINGARFQKELKKNSTGSFLGELNPNFAVGTLDVVLCDPQEEKKKAGTSSMTLSMGMGPAAATVSGLSTADDSSSSSESHSAAPVSNLIVQSAAGGAAAVWMPLAVALKQFLQHGGVPPRILLSKRAQGLSMKEIYLRIKAIEWCKTQHFGQAVENICKGVGWSKTSYHRYFLQYKILCNHYGSEDAAERFYYQDTRATFTNIGKDFRKIWKDKSFADDFIAYVSAGKDEEMKSLVTSAVARIVKSKVKSDIEKAFDSLVAGSQKVKMTKRESSTTVTSSTTANEGSETDNDDDDDDEFDEPQDDEEAADLAKRDKELLEALARDAQDNEKYRQQEEEKKKAAEKRAAEARKSLAERNAAIVAATNLKRKREVQLQDTPAAAKEIQEKMKDKDYSESESGSEAEESEEEQDKSSRKRGGRGRGRGRGRATGRK